MLGQRAQQFAFAVGIIASVALIGAMLRLSSYGFDLTDESLYIAWIARPWDYPISISQFGFIYHNIYLLMGEDIARLRQANILITVLLAWFLYFLVLRSTTFSVGWLDRSKGDIGIAFILATGSLGFLQTWLPTPSYNTLAMQALLIAGIGAVIADAGLSRASIFGWILIGTGGWLAFMAKPTTAAALAFVIVIYLLASRKWSWRLILLAGIWSFVLVLLTIWIIDGSIVDFVEQYKNSLEDSARLGAGHTIDRIFRLDSFALDATEQAWIFSLSLVVAVSTYLTRSSSTASQIIGACIVIAVGVSSTSVAIGYVSLHFPGRPFQALLFWCPFLGGAVGAAMAAGRSQFVDLVTRDRGALAAYFVVMPHVYAFGTGGNYWIAGGEVGVFWVLTGVILFGITSQRQTAWQSLLPISVTSLLVTTLLIDVGIQRPYRQVHSLYHFTGTLPFARSGGQLRVSAETASYIEKLGGLAKGAGFRINDPMIDLTGQNPGVIFALGAKAVGAAWLIGGYSGSNDWTSAILSRVPCDELARAWLLTEPNGHRHLSIDVLRRFGAEISRDYVDVGSVDSTTGSVSTSYTQHLLKPIDPTKVTAACKSLR